MHSDEFLQQMKERLEAEKARVEEKINKIKAPEAHMDNPQWDETANDAIEDVEQEAYLRIYRELSEKVDAALSRIENKTYGTCMACQKDVPEEALTREPWAEHCGKVCSV